MVKKIMLFTCLLLFSLFTKAQSDSSLCDNSGCVGDVKYSILKPESFRRINGAGWVLLNGNSDSQTDSLFKISSLGKLLQTPSLPDARGVFLRGMNYGRDTGSGNPEGDTNVGDFQSDAVGPHKHQLLAAREYFFFDPSNNGMHGGTGGPFLGRGVTPYTENNDGKETRPRNIVLYIYIKIK